MFRKIGVASFLCATVCVSTMPVAAQQTPDAKPVWRCGNSYSDQPCTGGKSVDVSDPRSATDRSAAEAATQRAASSASAMERDRAYLERDALKRDQANARANALAKARLDKAALHTTAHKPPKRRKTVRLPPDYFTAHGENAPAKRPARVSSR